MRSMLRIVAVAAIATLVPALTLADNQEIADQIAAKLRESGQLSDYKIAVKYHNGTAWLKGRVRNQQQMNSALKTAFGINAVTRVVNQLTTGSSALAKPPARPLTKTPSPANSTPKLGMARQTRKPPGNVRAFAKPKSISQSRQGMRPPGGAFSPERMARFVLVPAKPPQRQQRTWIAPRAERAVAAGNNSPMPQLAKGAVRPVAAELVEPDSQPSATSPIPRVAMVQPKVLMAPLAAVAAPVAMLQRVGRRPIPVAYLQNGAAVPAAPGSGGPVPMYTSAAAGGVAPARYDQPYMPNCAWPSYAAYPNYAALTYPKQYSPTAWPFIGPFYPYPQVPLGWRKVTLEWDDGWWMLDFKDTPRCCP